MHYSALRNGKLFFETYVRGRESVKVLDIGAQVVNGSLRSVAGKCIYTGADFQSGRGVDVVLKDPYTLPFPDETFDVVVSSSCFEHSEMFWLVFLEILRVTKPTGLCYINVPSNGYVHRYPVDCWRFYPDAGNALVSWAERNAIPAVLLESYISGQDAEDWSDFVAVFLKDKAFASEHPHRITHGNIRFYNARRFEEDTIKMPRFRTEDQLLLRMSPTYYLKRALRRLGESRYFGGGLPW